MDHTDQLRVIDSVKFRAQQTHIVDFIRGRLGLGGRFSPAEIHHVAGLHAVNNANLNLNNGGKGSGLYPNFARINHSCVCNTKTIKYRDNRSALQILNCYLYRITLIVHASTHNANKNA